ncbi:hypothetical protein MKX07_003231 [Trichoderma sp. CBMAI-0711]|nr:hypothetical protein MKX07_003231 [Trichoderma sp. CBMAI-0711]
MTFVLHLCRHSAHGFESTTYVSSTIQPSRSRYGHFQSGAASSPNLSLRRSHVVPESGTGACLAVWWRHMPSQKTMRLRARAQSFSYGHGQRTWHQKKVHIFWGLLTALWAVFS